MSSFKKRLTDFRAKIASGQPIIMGVLNVTPDSFSDGGQYFSLDKAVERGIKLYQDGADIIDIGGESTRPGASPVDYQQEIQRVIPVIQALNKHHIPISVDTSKVEVMQQAVESGAVMINDVRALQQPGCLAFAVKSDLPVCLMHMQGQPDSMQKNPQYSDLVKEISLFFQRKIEYCLQNGLKRHNLIIDPGFGFGKSLQHNLSLLKNLAHLKQFDLPLLVGLSRKSMLKQILDRGVEQRLAGSLALAMYAFQQGAQIIRVHDVAETRDVVKVVQTIDKQLSIPIHEP